jgi:serine/threonine protein kinase
MDEMFDFSQAKHVATFGRGKCGVLIQGYLYKPTNCLFAIKSVSPSSSNYERLSVKLKNECAILQAIQRGGLSGHQSAMDSEIKEQTGLKEKLSYYRYFIMRCFGFHQKDDISTLSNPPLYLCLESCLGGNLFQHLHHNLDSSLRFSIYQIRVYITQLINVLIYFSSIHLIHRDIKLSNILINSLGHIKLCDFDSAILLSEEKEEENKLKSRRAFTITGTLHILSPEMIAFGSYSTPHSRHDEEEVGYDESVDYWSLGHLLYELVTKTKLFLPWTTNETGNNSSIMNDEKKDKEPERNAVSPELQLNSYHRRIARESIINDEEKNQNKRTPVKSSCSPNCWNYEYHNSSMKELLSSQEKAMGKEEEEESKTTVRDFTSFVPDSFTNETENYSQANDLISRLLAVSPHNRFIYSAISSFREDSCFRVTENFYSEMKFHESLCHPFLISDLLFPTDLRHKTNYQEFIDFLNKSEEGLKSYSFPINEKIGFYELFPQFNERLSLERGKTTGKNSLIHNDDDELTDEQQALFKDF